MSRTPKRSCCYRNCAVINSEHPERTLFQFPKDEARAKKWIELGAVDTSVPGPKFMCDLHFSRIYMCFSARRKMLLNTAIPYEYGTEVDDPDQDRQNELILGDSVPDMVGSTSSSQEGETNAEEHLDDAEYEMLDTEDNQMTEIIYMDDLQQLNQEESVLPKSPPKTRIIKVEKLPTLVTSSSGTPANIPTLGTPNNIILRKVKIKKRPSSAITSPVSAKKSKPDVEPPVETTVTSSPEKPISPPKTTKKVQTVKITPSPASSSSGSAPKPPPQAAKPVKAPKSPAKPFRITIMEKRKDAINEFIFKGEEYVQLPKEFYLQDLDDVDAQLQQYKAKHSGEVVELEQLLEDCRAESEQCAAERDQYKAENERLEKKVEEYRMVIKNMKDVLGMFAGEDED